MSKKTKKTERNKEPSGVECSRLFCPSARWRSTAIKGNQCKISFEYEESVIELEMQKDEAIELMESIRDQLIVSSTSNPLSLVENLALKDQLQRKEN